ncbi:MAG TPA: PAS domain-containing protein [Actinomycetota bacterium]|jgi:PAS domain S-box-containing protein|nr:PAS domain-containing protein [Actinomycetota bacterium]
MSSSLTSVLADPGRLAALRQTNLLDSPAEAAFDRLARLAARVLGTPIAVVSLMDQDRQFFKAAYGMPEPWASARQAPISTSLCRYVLATGQPLVIGDVRWDALGGDNPFMKELGAVAYMGVPLRLSSGHVLGAFCVADRRPRNWTGEDLAGLKDLAGLVMDKIELGSDLHARKLADAALAEHNHDLWGALEAVPIAVVISTTNRDHRGPRIVHANRAFCELTGYPPAELIGSSLHLVQCPEAARSEYDEIGAWLESGSPWTKEAVSYRKDGTEYVARWQVAPLTSPGGRTTHWVCTQQDMDPHRRLERRLADMESRFQALLERVPAVVYTLSPDPPNPFTYVSPQIESLLGERAEDCVGSPDLWDKWVHPDDRDWIMAEFERTNKTGEPFRGEYRMRTCGGEVRWVRDEAILVSDANGAPLFWQGILTDITATREAASRLAEALEREQDTAEQLSAALERERAGSDHLRAMDKMKTTFLQAVSHDLRTPLTSVLGIALTLQRGAAGLRPEDVADLIGRLTANARKLDRLLSDLLDLDRLARGTLTPERKLTDVGALTRRSVEEAAVADEHPVVVDASPLQIAVDGPKVERIVENLVLNAARHTAAGTTIWVRVHPEDGGAMLVVEDEGPGVPERLREQIFQPFRQGHSDAQNAPGSGIGLALVSQFASLHGGRAWVEDRPGGGASFRVFIPGTPAEATAG